MAQQARTRPAAIRPAAVKTGERSEFAKTLQRLGKNKAAVGGAVALALILLTAVFAPALAPEDPLEQDYGRPDGGRSHPCLLRHSPGKLLPTSGQAMGW